MASITPFKDGYRVQVYVKGQRASGSFRTLREAKIWASQKETELREQSKLSPKVKHTLRYLLERYRDEVTPSKRGERWEYVRINAFLKSSLPIDKPLSFCTAETLGKWRDERLKVVSAGTVLRDFSLLSAIFEEARREWKLIDVNPMRDVRKPREPQHRDTIITWSQIKIILKDLGYSPINPVKSISHSVGLCFLVALRTGMRAGELCNLTWDNVHEGYCSLIVTKTVPRQVPLSDKALRLVYKLKGFDKHLVFGLKSQTLDTLFRRSKNRCKCYNIHFHDSRHTAATMMVANKKIDVLTLCKIFGWKNTSQALTYVNPHAKDISKLL